MFAEFLTVVGSQDDQRVIEMSTPLEFVEESPNLEVRVANALIVTINEVLDVHGIELGLFQE